MQRTPEVIRREAPVNLISQKPAPNTFLDIVLQLSKMNIFLNACREFFSTTEFDDSGEINALAEIAVNLSVVIVDIITANEINKMVNFTRELQAIYGDVMLVLPDIIKEAKEIFSKVKRHAVYQAEKKNIGLSFQTLINNIIPQKREKLKNVIVERYSNNGKISETYRAKSEEILTRYIDNYDLIDCALVTKIDENIKKNIRACMSKLGQQQPALLLLIEFFDAFDEVLRSNQSLADSVLDEEEQRHLEVIVDQYYKFEAKEKEKLKEKKKSSRAVIFEVQSWKCPSSIKRAIHSVDNISPIYSFKQNDISDLLSQGLPGIANVLKVHKLASAEVYRTYAGIASISMVYDEGLSQLLTESRVKLDDELSTYKKDISKQAKRYQSLSQTIGLIKKEIQFLSNCFQVGMRFGMPIENMYKKLQELSGELQKKKLAKKKEVERDLAESDVAEVGVVVKKKAVEEEGCLQRDIEQTLAGLKECIDFFQQKVIVIQIAKAINNYVMKMEYEIDVKCNDYTSSNKLWKKQDQRFVTRPILLAMVTYLSDVLEEHSTMEVTNLRGFHQKISDILSQHNFDPKDKKSLNTKDKGVKLILEVVNGIKDLMTRYHQNEIVTPNVQPSMMKNG